MAELKELFDKVDSEFLKFDRIPESERLHPHKRLCGMLKLYSLLDDKGEFDIHAEHDIVYLCQPLEITEEDAIYLTRCGITYDSEVDCLSFFT